MVKQMSVFAIAVALAAVMFSFGTLGAVTKAVTTAPATTKAALPACCGAACKKMGAGCCKADAQGKIACAMGGSCCVKPSTTPANAGK